MASNETGYETALKLPSNLRARTDHRAARRNDILRTRIIEALRNSGRFVIKRNVLVPLTPESRRQVRRAGGAYIGTSLPCDEVLRDGAVLDMVVIDGENRWAGGYALCCEGSHSNRARRRIEGNLRAAELMLRSHLRQSFSLVIDTVTVGVIDAGAEISEADDLTISAAEIEDHFDVPFPALEIAAPTSRRVHPK